MIKKQLLILLILLSSLAGYSQTTITPQWKSGTGYVLVFYPGKSPAGYDSIYYLQSLRSIFKNKADSVNNNGYVTHGYINSHFSSSTYMDLLTNQRASGTKSFLDGAIFGDNTASSYAVFNSAGLGSLIGSGGNLIMSFQEFGFSTPSYTPVFAISPSYAAGPGYNIISGTATHFTGPIIHEDTLRANLDPVNGKDVINLDYINAHAPTVYTASQGIVKVGSDFQLGGDPLTQDVTVDAGDSNVFTIKSNQSSRVGTINSNNGFISLDSRDLIQRAGVALSPGAVVSETATLSNTKYSGLYADTGHMTLSYVDLSDPFNQKRIAINIGDLDDSFSPSNNSIILTDNKRKQGAVYARNNYTFVDSSLITKKYVDNTLSTGLLATTLQTVTDNGNATTNPIITSNRIKKGSISSLTYFVTQGSSLTAGIGQADITADTSRYSFKVSNAQGYIDANYGVSGRSTQDVTTNSLYTVSSAMVSPPTPSSFVFLDCFVNDPIKDTTLYVIPTYTTQLTSVVNTLISKGWAANKIIIGNPSYWSTTAFSNHGNIPYRHSIYATATQSVATATGVFFYDGYDAMRIANNTNPIYVYSDSLHMTKAGQTFFANNLIAFINANSIAPAQTLTTVRDSTIGSINVYGNINAIGDINSAKRIFANDLYVSRQLTAVTPTFTSAALIGNNASSLSLLIGGQTGGGYAANTNKFFNIMAPTYAAIPGTNQANSLSVISGQQTATDNIVIFGKDNINLFGATRYSYYASTGPNNANTGVEVIRNTLAQNNYLNPVYIGGLITGTITSGFKLHIVGKAKVTQMDVAVPGTDSLMYHKSSGGFAIGAPVLPVAAGGTGATTSTGSGSNVLATSPTLVTPILGVATMTSMNKVAITAPATSATLTIANGKTLTYNNSITIAGTDATTMTFPTTSATVARTDAANTFTGVQSFASNPVFNTTSIVGQVWTATNTAGAGNWSTLGVTNRSHTIFTPTTGGTVTLVANQYNIINPAGALVALTVTLPSSPANNDTIQIKFTQAVTTVTYNGGTVADGITSPIAGGYVIFTFDSGSNTWY